VWAHVAEVSEGSVERCRASVRVLQTRDGCENPGLGTVAHWDPRVLCKAEDEIFISVGGCTESLNTTPMVC